MEWKCPKITIGDVPIMAQSFNWGLTSGVLPYETSIIMLTDSKYNEKLKKIKNPTEIKMVVTGGSKAKPEEVRTTFKNIYIIEPRAVDPFHTTWTISDARFAFRGKKMYCSYNKTRVQNRTGTAAGGNSTNPSVLRQPFDRFKKGRYLPWSVNQKKNDSPWNMKEIIELELKKLNIPFDASVSNDLGAFIVENVEINGESVYGGLANLLSRSRLNMGILPNGKLYVYSLDFFDKTQINMVKRLQGQRRKRPGVLYDQDMKRVRPSKIKVRFEKKIETRVVATSSQDIEDNTKMPMPVPKNLPVWDYTDVAEWKVIGCENVIMVPYPIKSVIYGTIYQIGEFVPMWDYLLSVGLTDQQIRENWFDHKLEGELALILGGPTANQGDFQLAAHIMSAIRKHYRQTYKIDPYFVDRIDTWEDRRVGVINNYDHFTPPSPLYADYCVLPKFRHPKVAKRTALWDDHAYNWIVNDRDLLRSKPTAGTVNIVSHPLGVFHVSYPSSVDRVVENIIPGALSPLPFPSETKAGKIITECHLLENHTLETIISVVWSTDRKSDFSGANKFFQIDIDYSSLKGEGPDLEYLTRVDYARFETKKFNDAGNIINNPNFPVNIGIIDAIASSESGKLMNSYIDRVSGIVVMDGYIDITLLGNIKAVLYTFSESHGLETIVDMREIPPTPTLEQTVPQGVLNFLQKQVTRGSNANEIPGV